MKQKDLRWIPNALSVGRIVLTVPVAACLLAGRYWETLALLALAGGTDGLDGYLARRYGWVSRLGGFLDAVADKLLLVTVFVVLAWVGLLPVWLVALVVGRDLVIVAGALTFRIVIGPYDARPSRLSKANTVLQVCLALAAIVSGAGWLGAGNWLAGLTALVAATTLISGVAYVLDWGRLAWRRKHKVD